MNDFLFTLCRFFKLMGRVFGFVAMDLEDKISILQKLRTSGRKEKYTTVQSMMSYELEENTVNSGKSSPSGSRTLLRLHRALEFVLEFMKKLGESEENAKTSVIATDVYHRTLSNHHTWIVRKMAGVAMYVLPSKKSLIGMMCKQDSDEVSMLLEQVCHAGFPVYETIQNLYANNNLLTLA